MEAYRFDEVLDGLPHTVIVIDDVDSGNGRRFHI
jgi:hypothetical protein